MKDRSSSHCGMKPTRKRYGVFGCEREPGATDGMCCCRCVGCDRVCVVKGDRFPSVTRTYQLTLFDLGG